MSTPTPTRYRWAYKGTTFDFYHLCEIIGITSHAQAHALKKVIRAGKGGKSLEQDIDEAIDSLRRWKEMVREDVGEDVGECQCNACWDLKPREHPLMDMRGMVLCPTCGNKRCPRANDHRNKCTGSNEPGQKGSSWENIPSFSP